MKVLLEMVGEIQCDNETRHYESNEKRRSFTDKLASWAITHKISRNACDELLKLLASEGVDVPECTKTLFRTKVHQLDICDMSPGQYFHFGLRNAIELLNLNIADSVDELSIDIFVDGIPLYKSSRKSLWLILGCISESRYVNPFLIGAYIGLSKPENVKSYLKKLVNEYLQIQNERIIINERKIRIKIKLITCDAPARAYVTGTAGHTSIHGCSKCQQKGKKINNRLSYSIVPGRIRSDDDFRNRTDKPYHSITFQNEIHPLELLNMQMVTQFPLDVMHLIDLGVMKKMLLYILNGKHTKTKLSSAQKLHLNEKILSIAKYTPKEFCRKPRTFQEIRRWKATEFRQFVLYTGIVVFKDILDDDMYYNFLMLHTTYRWLSCPENCKTNLNCVQQMFQAFVEDFAKIYGIDKISYNVHILLHLAGCVEKYGNLDNFSSKTIFKF